MKSTVLAGAAIAALLAAAPVEAQARHSVDIPMSTRLAPVEKVDAEARVVTLCWTTGAQVMRYDWYEGKRFLEELSLEDGAVDLSRLNDGAPLLNSHGIYSLESQIGVVERAWIESGKGYAEVRFPQAGVDANADRIFSMVKDKIIRNVSVGYRVNKYQITDNQGEGLDVWRAVSWMPMEISLVTVPADAGAGVRSEQHIHACEFLGRSLPATQTTTETEAMTEAERIAAAAAAAEQNRVAEAARAAELTAATTAAATAAATAERTRGIEIRQRVATAGLPAEFADTLISSGVSIEHTPARILDEMAARGTRPGLPANAGARTTPESIEAIRTAVAESILHRHNPVEYKLTEAGRNYRGLSILEVARRVLESDGVSTTGMTKMELAGRALHTTSDFPNILANVANKTLQAGYKQEQRTFLPVGTRSDAVDFKQKSSLILGEGSNLDKVNEKGEFTRGTIGEGKEAWQIASYGKVFGITRQALINDDLGAFTRLPSMMGNAGVRLENDIFWGILIANAALADGVTLFHANHKNLLTGGTSVLALQGLTDMRKQFRQQKGLDGNQTLNLEMKTIVVNSSLETTAEQLISSLVVPTAAASAIPQFIRSLQPIVEPRLDAISATVWFGFCDPSQQESIEYGYLEGQEGVYLETRIGFDVDGVELKARHDFGAKAVNFRGVQKSAGQ